MNTHKAPEYLVFRLDEDDRRLLVEAALARRLMVYDGRMARLNRAMHMYQRLQPWLFLMCPMFAVALMLLVQGERGRELPAPIAGLSHFVESQDRMVLWLSAGIVSIIWWLLCWRHGRSLLGLLRVQQDRFSQFTHSLSRGLVKRGLSRSLSWQMARLEGVYHLQVDDMGLRIRGPRSDRFATVPWMEVTRVVESARFYKLYTRASQRFGRAHVLVKQSNEMDDQAYQAGLQQLLRWSPVRPVPESIGS